MPLILRIIFGAMTTASPIDFYKKLKAYFPHEPTLTQERALEAFAQFVCNDNKDELLL